MEGRSIGLLPEEEADSVWLHGLANIGCHYTHIHIRGV